MSPERLGAEPYKEVFIAFFRSLVMLRELDKELPKSIESVVKKRERAILEKEKQLDEDSKKQLAELASRLRNRLEGGKNSVVNSFHQYSESVQELLSEILKTAEFSYRGTDFIRDMSLVYLIAEFKNFLRDVLKITFQRKPEILSTSQKSITYEELVKFKQIDDALHHIVEKEASSVVNKDIEWINKYFADRFKANMSVYTEWNEFKERFYRRNIIIHNDGFPNRIYRLKTGYNGKDRRMYVSKEYLQKSFKMFEDVSFSVSEHFDSKFT